MKSAGRSSEVERSIMVRWVVRSILHGVNPLNYNVITMSVLSRWIDRVEGVSLFGAGTVMITEQHSMFAVAEWMPFTTGITTPRDRHNVRLHVRDRTLPAARTALTGPRGALCVVVALRARANRPSAGPILTGRLETSADVRQEGIVVDGVEGVSWCGMGWRECHGVGWGGGSVMVWDGISYNHRTALHLCHGKINGIYYRDNVLRNHVISFFHQHLHNYAHISARQCPSAHSMIQHSI